MKFSLKTLLGGVLLIALFFVALLTLNPKPVDAEFATAKMGPLLVSVQEDGKTRIREKYTVYAPVSGRVSRIELKPGDYCTEETLVAVILPSDPAILDARARAEASAKVQAAESAVQRAISNKEQAKINNDLSKTKLERATSLLPSRAISQEQYDIAKSESLVSEQAMQTSRFDLEIAKYELEMAQAAVEQFNDENDDSSANPFEIHSPISGRVLRVIQESSAVINAGTPLIELGDPSNLEMEVDVLSTDAVRIKKGSDVTVEHWGGGAPLKGYVRVVEPAAFTKISSLGVEEQRVNIIVDFNEPPQRIETLGDGYRVEAKITVNQLEKALLIPNSALFRYQRRWHVMRVVDGHAAISPVSIGLQSDSQTQILEGLNVDDRVIVYPSDAIKPGTRVRLMATTSDTAISE